MIHKRIAIVLMVVLAAIIASSFHRAIVAAGPPQNNYATAFPATENPISESGNWINGGTGLNWGNMQTFGGHIGGTNVQSGCPQTPANCTDSHAALTGTWTADQSVCSTVYIASGANRTAGTYEIEIHLHRTISSASGGTSSGYELNYSLNSSGPYQQIVRWNGAPGSFSVLGGGTSVPVLNNGDIFCGSVIAGKITSWLLRAGAVIETATVTDATFTGGAPGVGVFNAGQLSDNANFGFSQFEAANLAAQTANSADVNSVVQGPLHTAVDGESILIPPGAVTWTSTSVTATVGLSFFGYGIPNGAPAAVGASASCSATAISTSGSSDFKFTPSVVTAPLSRVSCIASNYVGPSASIFVSAGGVCNSSACTNMRMDNITFNNWSNHAAIVSFGINVIGDMFGVLDHNTINGGTSPTGPFLQLVELNHASYQGIGFYGDNSWHQPENYGSSNFLFIENNQFNNSGCCENEGNFGGLTHQGGGRVVARFNTYNIFDSENFGLGWHGTESSGRPRSGRAFEYYGDTVNYPAVCNPVNSGNCPPMVAVRGGTGLAWGNTINAVSSNFSGSGFGFNFLRVGGTVGGWPACDGTVAEDGNDPAANASSPAFSGTLASFVGTGYTAGTSVATTIFSGPGNASGLTLNTTVSGGNITVAAINSGGTNYTVGTVAKISGGNADAAVTVTSVSSGVVTGLGLTFLNHMIIAGTNPGWTTNQWIPAGAPYSLHDSTISAAKQLAIGAEITANTANMITVNNGSFFTPYNAGDTILITRAFWCMDQGTRGAGVLLPTQTLPTVPPMPFSSEVLSPAYVWQNSFTNQAPGGGISGAGSDTARVIRNRDFYAENTNQLPQSSPTSPFNGTTASGGIGHGTFANISTTCTPGTAYWATDKGAWNSGGNPAYTGQGQLYICGAGGTFPAVGSPSYVPFGYPHFLVTGGAQPTGPIVSLSTTSMNFGSLPIGTTSSPQTLTISSVGTANLTWTAYSVTNPAGANFSAANGGTCPTSNSTGLAPGTSCTVIFTATPSTVGVQNGTFNFPSNAGGSPQTLSLSVTGASTAATAPSCTPTSGIVPKTVTCTNPNSGTTVMCYAASPTTPATNGVGTACNTGTVYSTALAISSAETLEVIAGVAGQADSSISSYTYTSQVSNNCPSPTSIGQFTLCSEAYNETNSNTASVNLSPFAGNGVELFVSFCGPSCGSAPPAGTLTISDNVNNPETCFVQSPHSPFSLANTSVPDFETLYALYCPSIPSGVTSLTATFSSALGALDLDAVEWKVGAIASANYFENTDHFTGSGATAGTTATVVTNGPTVNPNDLLTSLVVTCGLVSENVGIGYTGIIVNPPNTVGHVVEAKAVTATQSPNASATTTWSSGTPLGNCGLGAAAPNDTWFGIIVPLVGGAVTITPASINFGSVTVGVTSPGQVTTVSNNTASAITVGTINYTGTNPLDFATSVTTCSGTVAANGGSCTITTTFKPGAAGSRLATLNFNYSGGSSGDLMVSLSGTGGAPQVGSCNETQTTTPNVSTNVGRRRSATENNSTSDVTIANRPGGVGAVCHAIP